MSQTPSTPSTPSTRMTRRRMLLLAGAGGAGVALLGCGGDGGTGGASATAESAAGGAGATDAPGCVLTPEAIEGPFYSDVGLMRRDITEGRAGQKLELRLKVVDADGCAPLPDASVDVWHADATGLYSAFTGQGDDEDVDTTGQTFLRGIQNTDGDGVAVFDTIYPGWYRGRTTHIHVKVHFSDKTRITTQLYFPDDVTGAVYREAAYAERGGKDTSNSADEFGGDDQNLLMSVVRDGDRHVATGTLGVNRA